MRPSGERRFPGVGTVRYFLLRVHRADSIANGDSMNRGAVLGHRENPEFPVRIILHDTCRAGLFQGLEKRTVEFSNHWKTLLIAVPSLGKRARPDRSHRRKTGIPHLARCGIVTGGRQAAFAGQACRGGVSHEPGRAPPTAGGRRRFVFWDGAGSFALRSYAVGGGPGRVWRGGGGRKYRCNPTGPMLYSARLFVRT